MDFEQKTAAIGLPCACRQTDLNRAQAESSMIAARWSGFDCHRKNWNCVDFE